MRIITLQSILCIGLTFGWCTLGIAQQISPIPSGGNTSSQPVQQVTSRTAANTPPSAVRTAQGGVSPQLWQTRPAVPDIVAEVNGEKVTSAQLASECVRLHGETDLSMRLKRKLIEIECQRQGVIITNEELNGEIEGIAKQFGFPTEQFLKMLQTERGIRPQQYKEDIVWPLLAIRKLAATRLSVSEDDLQQEIAAVYGAGVQVREIVTNSRSEAETLRAELVKNPLSFATVAKTKSFNSVTAPYGGLVPPIRRYSVDPILENAVFALKEGEISPVIEWPQGNFIIFKCEQLFPSRDVDITAVRDKLFLKIRDDKTRKVSEELLAELEKNATIELTMQNPIWAAQSPQIAARVNGQAVTKAELASYSLDRHGEEVLDQMIGKMLIYQDCQKRQIQVTATDIDNDIRAAAAKNLMPKPDGSPDVEGWLKIQLRELGVRSDIYKSETVWPMVALKRLAADSVKLTEEDIQKGYESNYGPRVRCLAIVLDNARRAQEVWSLARNVANPDHFGDLAAKYSVDMSTRDGRGIMPMVQRHCGQPILEEQAFKLHPGEISEILQIDGQFIILYCLGQTNPVVVDIAEVREEISRNIYDKKLILYVERHFEILQKRATITNYMTGNHRSPTAAATPGGIPDAAATRKITPLQ